MAVRVYGSSWPNAMQEGLARVLQQSYRTVLRRNYDDGDSMDR